MKEGSLANYPRDWIAWVKQGKEEGLTKTERFFGILLCILTDWTLGSLWRIFIIYRKRKYLRIQQNMGNVRALRSGEVVPRHALDVLDLDPDQLTIVGSDDDMVKGFEHVPSSLRTRRWIRFLAREGLFEVEGDDVYMTDKWRELVLDSARNSKIFESLDADVPDEEKVFIIGLEMARKILLPHSPVYASQFALLAKICASYMDLSLNDAHDEMDKNPLTI